ncbi:hypothetical protein EDB49_11296 [Vibrio crassostreae]|nr:hypothetical protein EDB49_11296 [Vibrio crassostreae]
MSKKGSNPPPPSRPSWRGNEGANANPNPPTNVRPPAPPAPPRPKTS